MNEVPLRGFPERRTVKNGVNSKQTFRTDRDTQNIFYNEYLHGITSLVPLLFKNRMFLAIDVHAIRKFVGGEARGTDVRHEVMTFVCE